MKNGAGLTLFLTCTTLISGILAAFYLWRLKHQQSALAMREQTFRSLAENLPDSVIRWDVAGRCLYVNAVHERVVAMSAADLFGKTVGETFPEGQFALIEAALTQVITTGKAVRLVRFTVQVNDETKFHDVHLIPERDASGQLVSVLCIGRDMTDLYRLQDDLVARERELRALADSSPGMMGSFYARPDGSLCMPYVSPNIEKLFGLRPQDVAHDASVLMALNHPEDAQRVAESIAESARNMSIWHEEYRVLHPTLGERWFESHTKPEPHPQGGIIWYGYVHDITERKLQQQALLAVRQENEQRMLNYFENAPGFFYTLLHRPDGRYAITFASPGIRELFGIEPQAVMHSISAYLAVVHPDDVEMSIRLMEQAECALTRFQLEYRINHPSKGLRWMEVHAVPQRLPDGGTCWNGFIYDIHDRKRMEEQLAQREQEFRSLAESSPDSIIRYDLNHRILYLNDLLVRDLGLASDDEVIGKRPIEVWPDDRFAVIDEAANRVIASGTTETVELVRTRDHGVTRVGQIVVVPERDMTGRIIGTLAFGRDITAIREAERKLAHFIDNLPGLAYTFHLSKEGQASFPYVSKAIEEIYALKPEDVRDDMSPIHMLAHPDDRPLIEAATAESARTMKQFSVVTRVCRPDQPVRWLDVRSVPESQPDGSILWHGLMLDITERKQAEILLAQREREFRILAANMPDNIIRYNRQGLPLYINPTLERTLGDEAAAMMGTTPREYHPDGSYEDYAQLLDSVLASGEAGELEKILSAPDGTTSVHQIRMVPEFGENGEVVGALAIGRDITARKQMEQAILASEQKLRRQTQFQQSLLSGMRDANIILVMIENGCFVYTNDHYVGCHLGYAQGALPATVNFIELIHPDDRPRIAAMHRDRLAGKPVPDSYEIGALWSDGSRREYEFHVMLVPDTEPPQTLLLTLRIDERKKMENAVRRNQEMLANAQKIAQLGSWDWDVVKNRVEWSEMAFEIYTPDQRPAEPGFEDFKSSIHPDDLESVLAAVQSAFEHDTPFDLDHRVVSIRKGIRTVHAQGNVFRDASGKPVRMVGTVQDITERKQAELEREAFRTQLRGMAARQEEVREEERRHIAREVHDELGQILSALKLNTIVLARKFAQDVPALREHLTQSTALTDKAVGVARNIATALRPVALDMGFVPALEWLAECFENNTGTPIEIQAHDQDIELNEQYAIALFRIVQEALTNITRHAQAQRVTIVLKKDAGDDVLIVHDDGTGFDPCIRKENSFGLVGMQERALMLGGTLSINSRMGGGTEITVRIPAQVEEAVL